MTQSTPSRTRSTSGSRGSKSEAEIEGIAKMIPLGRLGGPEDIAGVVSFLAGPDSGWINGQVIRVNGGVV